MKERPLILFPTVTDVPKMKRRGFGSEYHYPSKSEQRQRLAPQLAALTNGIDNFILQTAATDIEPEFALVLEVVGDVNSFFNAVTKFNQQYQHNIEWISEINNECLPDDNFYSAKDDGSPNRIKAINTKIFCIVTNRQALTQMLGLWDNFSTGRLSEFPRGLAGLRDVFLHLKSIHQWGVQERLEETGLIDSWTNDFQDPNITMLKCEIELFYRQNQQRRLQAENDIISQITDFGGNILSRADIPEIGYHALLANIPKTEAQKMMRDRNVNLVINNDIMFLNPQGQSLVASGEGSMDYESVDSYPIADEPIVALFDGLPQENHALLRDLLIIDDPENYASSYQAIDRVHGTAMASLILRGELDCDINSRFRKIYVRPIMKPKQGLHESIEYVPENVLLVDKIHECIRRLFEPRAGRVGPTIKVVNLSIGIFNRPFLYSMSPLAKLVDWLSYKYKILFIISVGNYGDAIDLGMSFNGFKALSDVEKSKKVFTYLERQSRCRRLLSPAESVNALTIGAQSYDNATTTALRTDNVIPCTNDMPSPINALGRGYNNSIKPDILYKGGKGVLREIVGQNIAEWRKVPNNITPGIKHASPYIVAVNSPQVKYSFGTSNATALMSRNAVICYDTLGEIFDDVGIATPQEYVAVILKAMLVHGAEWNYNAKDIISAALSIPGRGADSLEKWVGHGSPNISKVIECTKNRITLIGYEGIKQNEGHSYEIPIPFSFRHGRILRKLTVTLATFASTKNSNQKYRESLVWFDFNDECKTLFGSRKNVSDKAARRGTLQHEIFETDAVLGSQADKIKIIVNCADNATASSSIITPYALLATFEIAEPTNIDVYQEILNQIKISTPVVAKITTS